MESTRCPTCGCETSPDGATRPGCGHAAENGAPTGPPPEWIVEPVPLEVREEFLRTFDEAEYWAALRETEAAGGVDIDDLVTELERTVNGGS